MQAICMCSFNCYIAVKTEIFSWEPAFSSVPGLIFTFSSMRSLCKVLVFGVHCFRVSVSKPNHFPYQDSFLQDNALSLQSCDSFWPPLSLFKPSHGICLGLVYKKNSTTSLTHGIFFGGPLPPAWGPLSQVYSPDSPTAFLPSLTPPFALFLLHHHRLLRLKRLSL